MTRSAQFYLLTTTAGIKSGELASMLKVSRTACSRWIHGHNEPAEWLVAGRLDRLVDAVNSAVQDRELPLPVGLSKVERVLRLRVIIKRHDAKIRSPQS